MVNYLKNASISVDEAARVIIVKKFFDNVKRVGAEDSATLFSLIANSLGSKLNSDLLMAMFNVLAEEEVSDASE